jgi:Mn-containing catalase
MFRHTSRLQFESKPDQPDPVSVSHDRRQRRSQHAAVQPGLHQHLWLKAIEELRADGLETTVAPNALFEEEYAEHATAIWRLSDGTSAQDGGWATGPQPDGHHDFGYLADPQPLGDAASAPAPDPCCMPPMTAPWASPAAQRWAPEPASPERSKTP